MNFQNYYARSEITQIHILDLFNKGLRSQIVLGDVGRRFAKVKLTSQRGQELGALVTFYGFDGLSTFYDEEKDARE